MKLDGNGKLFYSGIEESNAFSDQQSIIPIIDENEDQTGNSA